MRITRRALAALLAVFLAACSGSCSETRPATSGVAPAGRGTGGTNQREQRNKPYLILISFDGFRADYLDRFDLPNFRRVMQQGTRARAMVPVFPSLTFPNHYSLVTGLLPAHHGIVGNSFYDPERKEAYSFRGGTSVGDASWYRGEPIWLTAESQGMVAACYFWPGSEAPIAGVRPTIWKKYDRSIPNGVRVASVLEWLRFPDERRPHLITMYFSDLDSAAHGSALDGADVAGAARSLDRTLGELLDGLDALPIRDRIYLLLTSDHGMVETSAETTIMLSTLIDTADVRVGYSGPVTSLHTGGDVGRARQVRDRINARLQHGRAYLRHELPERYRYRDDPRIGDVVIVMEESWSIAAAPATSLRLPRHWGEHGWDPSIPAMHAIFVIRGPGIRRGETIPEVENVDVYPLMAELLELRPAAGIDGHPGRIRQLVDAAVRE
jgi:predicted AlkP superfamily pyrophosphatase or phosphodiesterase